MDGHPSRKPLGRRTSPRLLALSLVGVTLKDKKKRMEQRQKRRDERESSKSPGESTGEYEFPMPVFDEEAFHLRENASAKISIVGVGLGAVLGIVAAYAQPLLTRGDPRLWFLGLVFFLAGAAAIRPLVHLIGVDTAKMKGKDWLGHMATIFFTFLAAWILFSNPPFV
ncbi:MAG: hypothetical protein HY556_04445 [Euryarchaeota archaeon]|nr:hypothetical protein [Euryarchaeota archaeon]